MADHATNTSYPQAVERLPEINSSSRMLDPDLRHDVMHDKIHATLNALQDVVGTAAEAHEATVLDRLAAVEDAPPARAPVVVLSGSSYALADLTPGAWHVFTATAVAISIALEATSPIDDAAEYGLDVRGAGGFEIVPVPGVVVVPPKGGALDLEKDDFAVLKRISADSFRLVGSTVAA